jgi:hypothetical protein
MKISRPVIQKAVALYSVETLVTTSTLRGNAIGIVTDLNNAYSAFLYAEAV